MLPLFITPEEHPTDCREEDREDDDPDAETDDRPVVWARVWMLWYGGLHPSVWGWGRGERDSGLECGRGWWWRRRWVSCGCRGRRRRRRRTPLAFYETIGFSLGCSIGIVEGE